MANRDSPMGFIPAGRLDGSEIPVYRFPILATQLNGVFVGDWMKALSGGNVEAANDGDANVMIGACVGIEDTDGVTIGTHGSSVSTKYLPASNGGYAYVALALPDSKFRAQTAGSLVAADVFSCAALTANDGSTTRARSNHEITGTAGTTEPFRIIGKVDKPDNAWGTYVELIVVPGKSYWFTPQTGI